MGGYSSGRSNSKDRVEQFINLDISQLYHKIIGKKFFKDHQNADGVLVWNTGSSLKYSLRWLEDKPELTISVTFAFHDGRSQPQLQKIVVQTTTCNYGGVRYWLKCPYCTRRVRKLYGVGGIFKCRHCHNLTYASAQEAHKYDNMGQSLGVNMKMLASIYEADNLIQRWYKKEHLTKRQRRKLADHLELPLQKVRNKFYKSTTHKKQA